MSRPTPKALTEWRALPRADRERLVDGVREHERLPDPTAPLRDAYARGEIGLDEFENRIAVVLEQEDAPTGLRTPVASRAMTPTASPILRGAEDFERELIKTRKAIERRESDLEVLRARRNLLIYEGCEAGLTERKAAAAAGVSYGYAGQAHRGHVDPTAGK